MDNILNILSGGNKNEGWIVGPTYDRLFFVFPWIFGIFFPLLYLVLHRYSGLSDDTTIKIVFFCYLTFLNLPHVYLTYIRSNFDAKEFYRRKNFHTWTPILFLISGIPIYFYDTHDLFFLFYPILGPWHAMRQDWGFLKLYRLKYNEKDNEKLDYWFFHGQRILIMLTFQIFHVLNYFKITTRLSFFDNILSVSLVLIISFTIYVLFQVRKGLNHKKNLFLIGNSFGYLLLVWGILLNLPPLIFITLIGSYHDIQYQAWMNHYTKRRFGQKANRYYPPVIKALLVFSAITAFSFVFFRDYRFIVILHSLIVLFHYFIDGKIWKFSRSKELSCTYSADRATA